MNGEQTNSSSGQISVILVDVTCDSEAVEEDTEGDGEGDNVGRVSTVANQLGLTTRSG